MSAPLKVNTPTGLIGDNPICMFKGILIFMHLDDATLKDTPHFYAQYEGEYVVYSIPDGDVLKGDLPRNKKVLIDAWVELHRDELTANWMIIKDGELAYPLQPLR